MSLFSNMIHRYNSRISNQGRKAYIIRLIITTILETLALSVLPCYIDDKWEKVWIKIVVMFVLFSFINIRRYKKFLQTLSNLK